MGFHFCEILILLMKKANYLLSLSVCILFFGCAALKNNNVNNPVNIQATINLVDVNDDKVQITVSPLAVVRDEIIFRIPQIVPGTYEYSNFGRFVENLNAFDKKGNLLPVESLDKNSWRISNAKKLVKVSYLVNDTFDGPLGSDIYPMGGTSFKAGETFLLNLHSMIGYFDGMKEVPYHLSVNSPKNLKAFSSLSNISKSDSLDIFLAKRYFHIIDNPILYSEPNAVSFDLEKIKVGLAIYSPTGIHKAEAYQPAIEEMMIAQKNFLGEANNTNSYDILLHLMDMNELQYFGGMMGALEHHTSTTVVFVDQMKPQELTQNLVDVVSHEFFHTLTPLNIHSEEIHDFEYNTPLMSKHLWMYEGTTEYFANLFQINQGLINANNFYNRLHDKVELGRRYDDTMSFTEMSAGIVEDKYQKNYGNVYQKGALINMCLDIIIRENSGGEIGILWVMKNLAERYGNEKPFKDDALIDEIVSMTYPDVGVFFENHVIGNTPIKYSEYFSKVGLIEGKVASKLPSIFFQEATTSVFLTRNIKGKGNFLAIIGLNSSLKNIGIKLGDILLGINGQTLPEINQENGLAINNILNASYDWSVDQEVVFSLERDGKEMILSGKVETPSYMVPGIIENSAASEESIKLRKAWMFK